MNPFAAYMDTAPSDWLIKLKENARYPKEILQATPVPSHLSTFYQMSVVMLPTFPSKG